ncbi:MAG: hypothetical protein VYE68_15140 [Acidobacteriota bacterium]|nr:hypothetical protein [Acidobacteriota bacterium]
MNHSDNNSRHLYWFDEGDFESSKKLLCEAGCQLEAATMTPCQVLRARGKNLVYGSPEIWSRLCVRQGSWYRHSDRHGHYMVGSDHRLPEALDAYLDSEMFESDFAPESMPTAEVLNTIVSSEEYQSQKPDQWEKIRTKEAVMVKLLFLVNRFWGFGDNLKK